ncbi:hypothetical protein [Mesorhizobium sp.]|uniref:hypothetical protein n=1 Tax=Mesorhizobium sp. TaxID=1871066 RepID=UPI0025BDB265|nr:hypothetical protein [Mesorhizobium sp.]
MMYPLSIAFGLAAGLTNLDQRGSDGIRTTGELFVRIALAGPVPGDFFAPPGSAAM